MSVYHTAKELKAIKNWDVKDTNNLIFQLKNMWEYNDCFIENWGLDRVFKKRQVLTLELHTGGWSGNEEIIAALKQNKLFWMIWWWKTEKGGHYYFEIDFQKIGFKPVSEFLKERNISRQYLYKFKENYEWVKISHGKRLIRAIDKSLNKN